MKKMLLYGFILFLFLLTLVQGVQAAYPLTQAATLAQNVRATAIVRLKDGMQIATVSFQGTGASFGAISLTPVQSQTSDVTFTAGKQILKLSSVTFRSAFNKEPGYVRVTGTVTDENGKNPTPFTAQVATWNPQSIFSVEGKDQ